MDHSQPVSRYEVLSDEDDPPDEYPHTEPTPSTQELAADEATEVPSPNSGGAERDFPPPYAPPPYSIATSLPTYEEAEKAAAMAMAAANMNQGEFPPQPASSEADRVRLGSDGMFILAFVVAFLFNWIGFCISFCLSSTIAGRYGALSGFGLSLISCIFIIRFSDYFNGYVYGQYWLWWLFLIFGFLLFFRGTVSYLKVRNMPENTTPTRRIRFYFLY